MGCSFFGAIAARVIMSSLGTTKRRELNGDRPEQTGIAICTIKLVKKGQIRI